MTPTKMFNFSSFKSVMDISDIDEPTYGFILRSIFSTLKKTHGIDLEATTKVLTLSGSTTTTLILPLTLGLLVDQIVVVGSKESSILSVTSTLTDTTIVLATPLLVAPLVNTNVVFYLTVVQFDLQYAIYQHAKFLFEGQKKNTQVVDSVTDTAGNKATYKAKPSKMITSVYLEYSTNPVAF